ncbi:hypothetical protein EDB87DRAFT_1642785 [Lactarius vividus]|nr:hypothetical protein EDB87DRAFT_1642785 [Lactarius vividus]
MITEDQRVLLVDFDWCGEHEKDTYPVSLNDNRYTPNGIHWHPGVKRGDLQSDITPLHNPPPATTSSQDREHIRLGKRKTRA